MEKFAKLQNWKVNMFYNAWSSPSGPVIVWLTVQRDYCNTSPVQLFPTSNPSLTSKLGTAFQCTLINNFCKPRLKIIYSPLCDVGRNCSFFFFFFTKVFEMVARWGESHWDVSTVKGTFNPSWSTAPFARDRKLGPKRPPKSKESTFWLSTLSWK